MVFWTFLLKTNQQEKKNKITITNDSGRLTKDQIDQMLRDAEKYKEEDEKHAAKMQAKNKLEQLCYSIKQTTEDEKTKDKIQPEDKTKLQDKVKEIQQWIESNENAEAGEYESKQKELESVSNPIMTKLYADGGAPGGMPGGMPDFGQSTGGADPSASSGSSQGPTVEEVD